MRTDTEPKSINTRVELAKAGAIGGLKGGVTEYSRQRTEKLKEADPKASEWDREVHVIRTLEKKRIAKEAARSATLSMAKRFIELEEVRRTKGSTRLLLAAA